MKINENKFDWFFIKHIETVFFIKHIETVFLLNTLKRFFLIVQRFFVHGSILFRKSETNNVK